MPELPEVETMRRGAEPVVGSTILDVVREPCPRKPIAVTPRIDVLRRRCVGRKIVAVERLGKRVLLRTDDRAAIIFEPRMTGLVLLADPPTRTHLRLRLDLEGGPTPHLWYWDRRGLGNVRLLAEDELQAALLSGRLGPDALQISDVELQAALRTSRRAIKVALLDQKAVAGIGNLYAAEILHLAGVHPERPCDRLRRPQWQRIHQALREVLQLAIQYEGSTLADGTYRNALNAPGSYQNHHRVYDREGETCRSCGKGLIRRIVQAQRATFFCPRCQRKR